MYAFVNEVRLNTLCFMVCLLALRSFAPCSACARISLKIRISGISRFYAQSRAFKHAAAVLNEQLQLFSRIPFPELVGSLLPTQMAQ